MAWIDDASYPWSNPLARDLHKRLVDTFYEPADVRTLVRSAKKPNVTKIAFEGRSIHQIWVDTLDRASSEGALRTLLKYIVDETSIQSDLATFVRELLAEQSPPVTSNPASKDAPAVVPLTQPEALLYGHDLSESVGEIPELVASIARVMTWRSSVCHLQVTASNGGTYLGTGTLLVGNRVLSNHHVMYPDGNNPTAVSVVFNFEQDAKGQNVASNLVPGDLTTIKSSKADDWATFEIAAPPPGITVFDLGSHIAVAQARERAFILQHPKGQPKRLAFVRNRISEVQARRVFYVTDTEGGSSGAPVFNGAGRIIALHRAGGVPQKFPGTAPVKNNEGVRIDVIAPEILQG